MGRPCGYGSALSGEGGPTDRCPGRLPDRRPTGLSAPLPKFGCRPPGSTCQTRYTNMKFIRSDSNATGVVKLSWWRLIDGQVPSWRIDPLRGRRASDRAEWRIRKRRFGRRSGWRTDLPRGNRSSPHGRELRTDHSHTPSRVRTGAPKSLSAASREVCTRAGFAGRSRSRVSPTPTSMPPPVSPPVETLPTRWTVISNLRPGESTVRPGGVESGAEVARQSSRSSNELLAVERGPYGPLARRVAVVWSVSQCSPLTPSENPS